MKKKFIDTNIENKSKTVEEKIQFFQHKNQMLPLPTEIEISESGEVRLLLKTKKNL